MMSPQESSGRAASDLPPGEEYPGDGPGLADILSALWLDRVRILLLAGAGGVIAAAILVAVYLLRPTYQEASMTVRPLFEGAARGQYPSGEVFTPSDLVSNPVLEEVYRRNRLETHIDFVDFKEAFAVTDQTPALERLRREFRGQLEDRRLTPADRSRLEESYAARQRSLQNGEFTLVAELGGRFSSWPPTMVGKVMEDILGVWAERSRARGVFKFEFNIFSENILTELTAGEDDYLILLDRLRVTVGRILTNLNRLESIPGAYLVRVGETQVSLGEIQAVLEDDLKYRLSMIEAPVHALGFYRNLTMSQAYVREQIFRLDREKQSMASRMLALNDALATYSASRLGGARSEAGTSGGVSIASSGAAGESFLDRVMDLSTQGADINFRQELVRQSLDLNNRLADLASERAIYERMQGSLQDGSARAGMDRDEMQAWVADQVKVMLAGLQDIIGQVRLLHEEISQRQLQPSTIYTTVEPLYLDRVSTVGMRNAVLLIGFLWCVWVGGVLVVTALRGLARR